MKNKGLLLKQPVTFSMYLVLLTTNGFPES